MVLFRKLFTNKNYSVNDEKQQVFHDILIFPEKELTAPNDTHLQMSDGIIILDHDDIGKHFLETLKNIESEPLSITDDENQDRVVILLMFAVKKYLKD